MASGGKREGAGRKAGIPNKATQERQQRVEESGVTPLDVMIETMRFHHAAARAAIEANPPDLAIASKALGAASDVAKDAAPYVHPKLAAIQHTGADAGPIEFKDVTDAKDRLAHFLSRQVAAGLAAASTSGTE